MTYDSTADTKQHIEAVQEFLTAIIWKLDERRAFHDRSKLESPEKESFDEFTPRLKALTYGSDEYKSCLEAMRPTLEHHYAANSHHPEHWRNGVDDMSLLDVVEMLVDWKAATLRHANGNILESLEINRARFGLSDQLYTILKNTVERMDWA